MVKRKVSGVEITADRLVAKLIDRLLSVEGKLERITQELNSHMEMIAEFQPKMLPDRQRVRLRVMDSTIPESSSEYDVDVLVDAIVDARKTQ